MQGWAEGQLQLSDTLSRHIDQCLSCGSCEAICPAKVPYTRLIKTFRAATNANNSNKLSRLETLTLKGLTESYRPTMSLAVDLYQKAGLNKLPLAHNNYLASTSNTTSIKSNYPALGSTKRGHIALFTGCASEVFDKRTLHDSIFLLQHCGFEVSVPSEQTCCGALDVHAGKQQAADSLNLQNTQAFCQPQYDAVASVASGCGATLINNDGPLAAKVSDINQLIAPYIGELSFADLNRSAWLQTPCTLKNMFPEQTDIPAMLSNINGLSIHPLNSQVSCCGAAGSYMLKHPEIANQLREKALAPVQERAHHYLLSSNIGCAMHLRAGLKQAGTHIEVLHPVSLLAQQLRASL
mgnify:CR=1 FL=1